MKSTSSKNHLEVDCELADIIPTTERHKITPLLGHYNLHFLSQITTPDRLSLRSYAELRSIYPNIPLKESQEKAVWYPCLRESLTGQRHGPLHLLPCYLHTQSHNQRFHGFHYPTARGMNYRVDPYDL